MHRWARTISFLLLFFGVDSMQAIIWYSFSFSFYLSFRALILWRQSSETVLILFFVSFYSMEACQCSCPFTFGILSSLCHLLFDGDRRLQSIRNIQVDQILSSDVACSIDGIKASYFFPLCQLVSDLQFSDREKSLTCFRTYCDRPGSTVNPLRHARHGWRRRDRHFTATAAASVDAIATPVDEAAFAAPPPPPTPPSPRRRRRRRCSCGCSTRRTMPRLVRELVAGSKATVPTPQNFVVRFASENRSKCQFTKQLVLGKGCISNYKWNLQSAKNVLQ